MNNNESSPLLMAYLNKKNTLELIRIGIVSLVQKGYVNVKTIQRGMKIIYSINDNPSGVPISEEESLILEALKNNKDHVLFKNSRIYRLSKYIEEIMNEEIVHLYKIKNTSFLLSIFLFPLFLFISYFIISKIGNAMLIVPLTFIIWGILVWCCYKNRIEYTEKGKKTLEEINSIKTNLKYSIQVGDFPEYNTVDELVNSFKDFLPLSLALGLEKETIIYLDKIIEKSRLNKETTYNRLNMLAYNDFGMYSHLKMNYLDSPEYKKNKNNREVITRKGKHNLWD